MRPDIPLKWLGLEDLQARQAQTPNPKLPFFINQYILSKEIRKEINRFFPVKWTRFTAVMRIVIIFAFFMLFVFVSTSYTGVEIVTAILLFLFFTGKIRITGQIDDPLKPQEQITVTFFDNYVFSHDELTDGKLVLDYSQILQVSSTKQLYFLKIYKGEYLVLNKTGFMQGSPSAFERFIQEKAVNAKIKLR